MPVVRRFFAVRFFVFFKTGRHVAGNSLSRAASQNHLLHSVRSLAELSGARRNRRGNRPKQECIAGAPTLVRPVSRVTERCKRLFFSFPSVSSKQMKNRTAKR